MKNRILIFMLLMTAAFASFSQEAPPPQNGNPNFKQLSTAQFWIQLPDSILWMYKGGSYGWVKVARMKDSSTAGNGLTQAGNKINLGGDYSGNLTIGNPSGTSSYLQMNPGGATIANLVNPNYRPNLYLSGGSASLGWTNPLNSKRTQLAFDQFSTVFLDENFNRGIVLGGNYEANFVDGSLTSKRYVDSLVNKTISSGGFVSKSVADTINSTKLFAGLQVFRSSINSLPFTTLDGDRVFLIDPATFSQALLENTGLYIGAPATNPDHTNATTIKPNLIKLGEPFGTDTVGLRYELGGTTTLGSLADAYLQMQKEEGFPEYNVVTLGVSGKNSHFSAEQGSIGFVRGDFGERQSITIDDDAIKVNDGKNKKGLVYNATYHRNWTEADSLYLTPKKYVDSSTSALVASGKTIGANTTGSADKLAGLPASSYVTLNGAETLTNKTVNGANILNGSVNSANIVNSTINNTNIGGSSAGTGRFTSLQATGNFSMVNGSNIGTLSASTLTGNRNWTAPDSNGQLALKEDFGTGKTIGANTTGNAGSSTLWNNITYLNAPTPSAGAFLTNQGGTLNWGYTTTSNAKTMLAVSLQDALSVSNIATQTIEVDKNNLGETNAQAGLLLANTTTGSAQISPALEFQSNRFIAGPDIDQVQGFRMYSIPGNPQKASLDFNLNGNWKNSVLTLNSNGVLSLKNTSNNYLNFNIGALSSDREIGFQDRDGVIAYTDDIRAFNYYGTASGNTLTVVIGATMPNTNYIATVTPASESASEFTYYITNKTTTSFDIVFKGTLSNPNVSFDCMVKRQ